MNLPDNRFSEVVEDMRNDGASWDDIFHEIDRTYDVVDREAMEESKEDIPAVWVKVRRYDGSVEEQTYAYQEDESFPDVVRRVENAHAELIKAEDGHTVTVLK